MLNARQIVLLLAHRLHNAGVVVAAVGVLALIAHLSAQPLLMAPFSPSILVILAQPRNQSSAPNVLIAAYVVAAVISVLLKDVLPPAWWSVALTTGGAMLALEALDILHPPAVAVPILVMLGNGEFPLAAFTTGVVALAVMSMLGRRLPRWSAVAAPAAAPSTPTAPTLVTPSQNAA
ncbi:MAG: HPP family protein [Rhodospirillaceae bacterium]|nr:HPP family protein [Rhodospirillaceae bacterium]